MATPAVEDMQDTHEPVHRKGELLEIDATRDITRAEHELGFWAAARQYPMAVFWSIFCCIAVITAGYDGQIIFSFYALPAFQDRYGIDVGNGSLEIPAPWQTGLGMGNPIGQVVGAIAGGWAMEKFGRRLTLAVCCVWSIVFVFVQFFSKSLAVLCVGEVLGGLAYGFYVVIAPAYASEICPLALRGVLTAGINLAFVIGQFIAQGVAAGVEARLDQWAYKAPFALQWLWPTVMLLGLPWAPESPYWLIRQGRRDDARASIVKLSSKKNPPDYDQVLLGIEQTDLLERELEENTSYFDLWRGSNAVRTEITVMVYLIQVLAGNPLIGYSNYFFEQAGLAPAEAFNMGVGNTALGFVGTFAAFGLLNGFNLGRRTIYLWGMIVMTVILFVMGFLAIPKHNDGAIWALASLLDIWTFIYQMTIGPICFTIISEISSTRLRTRSIAVSTAIQSFFNIISTIAMPYMLNADQANWGGYTSFLFGGFSFFCTLWCVFRLPESQGRTFEELDIMFEKRVPLRQFKTYDLLGETTGLENAAVNDEEKQPPLN